nr:hypothetical protein [Hyphomicrobiales bacterium]
RAASSCRAPRSRPPSRIASTLPGPHVIVAKVEPGSPRLTPIPLSSLVIRDRFRQAVRPTRDAYGKPRTDGRRRREHLIRAQLGTMIESIDVEHRPATRSRRAREDPEHPFDQTPVPKLVGIVPDA